MANKYVKQEKYGLLLLVELVHVLSWSVTPHITQSTARFQYSNKKYTSSKLSIPSDTGNIAPQNYQTESVYWRLDLWLNVKG